MKPIAHHVTLRLVQDQVIAPKPEARRLVARSVLKVCRGLPLVGFACVDTHLHLVLALLEAAARELGRRVAISLQRRLGLASPFERARPRPIGTVWHLQNALRYVFLQGSKHGLPWEAYLESSSLPDLLGMRPLGAFVQEVVRQRLPRLRRMEVLTWMDRPDLAPADGPVELLPEAAKRAAALGSLDSRGEEAREARAAMLTLAKGRMNAPSTSSLLGVSRRSVYRLARCAASPSLVQAIRLWLGWMTREGGAVEQGAGEPCEWGAGAT